MEEQENLKSLCVSCRFVRMIRNARGSVFWLCEYHRRDPVYAKYPRQPVTACAAYQKKEE